MEVVGFEFEVSLDHSLIITLVVTPLGAPSFSQERDLSSSITEQKTELTVRRFSFNRESGKPRSPSPVLSSRISCLRMVVGTSTTRRSVHLQLPFSRSSFSSSSPFLFSLLLHPTSPSSLAPSKIWKQSGSKHRFAIVTMFVSLRFSRVLFSIGASSHDKKPCQG